mmetsp:Transcript_28076/g.57608  ORF Transcript_28076/g.57608 Transcript_28076/m.57608 type:complete len:216 (+) Transcript_28076:411-1058(+)
MVWLETTPPSPPSASRSSSLACASVRVDTSRRGMGDESCFGAASARWPLFLLFFSPSPPEWSASLPPALHAAPSRNRPWTNTAAWARATTLPPLFSAAAAAAAADAAAVEGTDDDDAATALAARASSGVRKAVTWARVTTLSSAQAESPRWRRASSCAAAAKKPFGLKNPPSQKDTGRPSLSHVRNSVSLLTTALSQVANDGSGGHDDADEADVE